jgi:HPt (histidine-containing phosphotransfer) domain-containing protein
MRPRKGPMPAEPVDSPRDCCPIDTRRGLARVLGNTLVYNDLLLRFREKQADVPVRLQSHVANGELAEAVRTAHTLKAVSGSIGALQVAVLAEELEQTLAEEHTPDAGQTPAAARTPVRQPDFSRVAALLQALQPSLAEALQFIDEYLPPAAEEHAGPESPARGRSPVLEAHSLRKILVQLQEQTADSSLQACTLFEDCKKLLAAYCDPVLFARLSKAMHDFDFSEATAVLSCLVSSVDTEIVLHGGSGG